MDHPNIHILGIQGSGKGTQSALLVKEFGLTYAASGDLFRKRAAVNDNLGREIGDQLQKGRLLPDSYLIDTVDSFLGEHPVNRGLLSDGVIRTVSQFKGLLPVWAKHSLGEPYLIHLILSEEVAKMRIAKRQAEAADPSKREHHLIYGGKLLKRTDDNPWAIEERFALFHHMTEPVIRLFDERDACLHVDADQPIEGIHQAILTGLLQRYPSLSHVPH